MNLLRLVERHALAVTALGSSVSALLWSLILGALSPGAALPVLLLVAFAVAGRWISGPQGRGDWAIRGRALILGSTAIAMLWLGAGVVAFGVGWVFVLGEVGAETAAVYGLIFASLAFGAPFLGLGATLLIKAARSVWRTDLRTR